MNPVVNSRGRSFKGAFAYFMHDKGTNTRNRVAWTHTCNMLTADIDKAWKVMAYTAMHQDRLKEAAGVSAAGRKATHPVFSGTLSWHPEMSPTPEHMREMALKFIDVLGMSDREAVLVAHSDTPHKHVHIIVNRVHPVTGKIAREGLSFRKLSDMAAEYAKEHNLTYSPQREENKKQRESGKASIYMNPDIQAAWSGSVTGKEFIAALKERGFELVNGTSRICVVDPYGKVHNPTRHLEGVDAKVLRAKLADVDLSSLRNADEVAHERAESRAREYEERQLAKDAEKAKAPAKDKSQIEREEDKTPAPKKAVEPVHAPTAEKPAEKEQGEPKAEPKQTEHQKAPQGPAVAPGAAAFTKEAAEKADAARAAAEVEAAKKAKEEYNLERLAEIQNRHLTDRHEVGALWERRIAKHTDDMTKFYRLNESQAEIEAWEKKCTNQPWWREKLGLAGRDREQLENLKKSRADAEQRFKDEVGKIETAAAKEEVDLRVTQQKQWQAALRLYPTKQGDTVKWEQPENSLDREFNRQAPEVQNEFGFAKAGGQPGVALDHAVGTFAAQPQQEAKLEIQANDAQLPLGFEKKAPEPKTLEQEFGRSARGPGLSR